MDSQDISPALLKAGQEYLEALRGLKLQPEGLLWSRVSELGNAIDGSTGQSTVSDVPGDWHLVLITSAIDEGGPSALNELLFKAYDASATPQEISPFIVEVISARSPFVRALLHALNNPFGPTKMLFKTADGREVTHELDAYSGQTMIGGLWFDRKWIYHLTGLTENAKDIKRHWREFKETVNALAA